MTYITLELLGKYYRFIVLHDCSGDLVSLKLLTSTLHFETGTTTNTLLLCLGSVSLIQGTAGTASEVKTYRNWGTEYVTGTTTCQIPWTRIQESRPQCQKSGTSSPEMPAGAGRQARRGTPGRGSPAVPQPGARQA